MSKHKGHRQADAILFEARKWIGTPYVHQASALDAGCDCLGLIRGVWRGLIGPEPVAVPGYSADWGEVSARETMLETAGAVMQALPVGEAGPGDVIVFRWRETTIAKHAGILTGDGRFIHAYERAGVVETALTHHWQKRIAAAFRLPDFMASDPFN